MRHIEFTIKTAYSEETYYLNANDEESIERQIENALAEICFCDNYEIEWIRKVSRVYMIERKAILDEYAKRNLDIDEEFTSGHMTCNSVLADYL